MRNNIGKDLSKVSMPVELNEPLNTLQHLCEEIEYSELLDKASETDNPYERMVINNRAAPFGDLLALDLGEGRTRWDGTFGGCLILSLHG